MRAVRTPKPGQKGTKDWMTRCGPSSLCVQYRYDEHRREHLKTVALVVQRHFGNGNRSPGSHPTGTQVGVAARQVAPRIGWREREREQRVKSAGGRWDPDRRIWYLRRDVAERLDLLPRGVGGGG